MTETEVCLDLFLDWLNHTQDQRFRLEGEATADACASDGTSVLRVAVRRVLHSEDAAWETARKSLEERLGQAVPATTALWVPLGADLPRAEPASSDFVDQVSRAAVRLGPTERSHVPFPITLRLRKVADSGGVVSVTGGLNSYWARFTERVNGTYELDSSALHRLPESEDHLERLLDTVVEAAQKTETGAVTDIETIDAWTIQRLAGKRGMAIIGAPPAAAVDTGLSVRRDLRRALAEAGPSLRNAEAGLRALVVVAPYARMEGEGVTTALRGYDPVLYGGLDFVCIVCDGRVRPVVQSPVPGGAPRG